MSSLPKGSTEPPRRRHALFFTFISFIALGGLVAFYFTSVFEFHGQSWDWFSSPVEQDALKPQSTVIRFHSDVPITVVAEEFVPYPTVVSVASTATPSPPSSNTPKPHEAPSPAPYQTAVDFTDPFNITRNVFYGISIQYRLIDRSLAGRDSPNGNRG